MQIYIHIPFCEQKCGYCRFASTGSIQKFQIEKYVRYLCKEISLGQGENSRGEPCVHPNKNISTIYFGGGTPGVLSCKQLGDIFLSLKNNYTFSKNIEITLETTPDKITHENIQGWKILGINRISMGVQTLNFKSLQTIGRENKGKIEQALHIIENNVEMFGKNISLDFIIGLPYVKKGEIKKDIEYILNKYKFISHISVYMLEDYYSADKVIETKYDNIIYPQDWGKLGITEEEYLGEYTEIKSFLESQGFTQYEISNYAKVAHPQPLPCKEGRDYRCKHNMGYWNHSEVLGFGLGAYGLITHPQPLPNKDGSNRLIRYANSEVFSEYYQGKRILETELSEEDIFLETVMFQLRTSGLISDIYTKLNQEKLEYFIEEKCLNKKGDIIILSDKGVLVMDYILREIVL